MQPGYDYQHSEKPGEEMIARGRNVKDGDRVLNKRGRTNQTQPRIEAAAADYDIN
jgi:hypothetical protein